MDHFLERCPILTRHLPESGQSGDRVDSLALGNRVLFKFVHHAGAGANQTHIAKEHVDDLRQFIDAECPQDPATRNEPGITLGVQLHHRRIGNHKLREMVLMYLRVRADSHRAKLEYPKPASAKTDPALSEK